MDDGGVDRRTFLKAAGVAVTASAIAMSVPGLALGSGSASVGAERFLLGTAAGHVEPAVLSYVSRAIGA
jgi:hypothetical protein